MTKEIRNILSSYKKNVDSFASKTISVTQYDEVYEYALKHPRDVHKIFACFIDASDKDEVMKYFNHIITSPMCCSFMLSNIEEYSIYKHLRDYYNELVTLLVDGMSKCPMASNEYLRKLSSCDCEEFVRKYCKAFHTNLNTHLGRIVLNKFAIPVPIEKIDITTQSDDELKSLVTLLSGDGKNKQTTDVLRELMKREAIDHKWFIKHKTQLKFHINYLHCEEFLPIENVLEIFNSMKYKPFERVSCSDELKALILEQHATQRFHD